MKKTSLVITTLLLSITLSTAFAKDTSTHKTNQTSTTAAEKQLKIGIVDVQAVLADSPAVKKIKSDVNSQYQPKIDQIKQSLQTNEEKLKKDGITMKAADKAALEEKIKADYQQGMELSQESNQVLQNKMTPIFQQLQQTVNAFAKKHHYDIIIPKSSLLFEREGLENDITSQISDAFNAADKEASTKTNDDTLKNAAADDKGLSSPQAEKK
ncbi:MAG: OmpH family outer membrane protein [Pseudomonadota bacterium]